MLEALLAGLSVLPDETARLYHDLVMSRLSATTRQALEGLMKKGNYEYQSDFARQHHGEGLTEGKAPGVAKGLAEALLDFASLDELETWLDGGTQAC